MVILSALITYVDSTTSLLGNGTQMFHGKNRVVFSIFGPIVLMANSGSNSSKLIKLCCCCSYSDAADAAARIAFFMLSCRQLY
jgi:hypothetical protein